MKNLEDALDYAITIIESYQMDIKYWDDGRLLKEGFCQGTIYKKALEVIKKLEKEY
jgi:hypothetical protein